METQWDAAKVTKEEKGRKPNIKDLFLTKNMRLKTLIICFSWYGYILHYKSSKVQLMACIF